MQRQGNEVHLTIRLLARAASQQFGGHYTTPSNHPANRAYTPIGRVSPP